MTLPFIRTFGLGSKIDAAYERAVVGRDEQDRTREVGEESGDERGSARRENL